MLRSAIITIGIAACIVIVDLLTKLFPDITIIALLVFVLFLFIEGAQRS